VGVIDPIAILRERADEVGGTNATLGAFYEGVERPDHPDEKTADWLDARLAGRTGEHPGG
jgi:hypothetical protein